MVRRWKIIEALSNMCLTIQTWLGVLSRISPLVLVKFPFLVFLVLYWYVQIFINLNTWIYGTFSAAYLGSIEDAEITELILHEYKTATNLTEQFAALIALDQIPGKTRDEVLADFYSKWQHDFLVCLCTSLFLSLSLCVLKLSSESWKR